MCPYHSEITTADILVHSFPVLFVHLKMYFTKKDHTARTVFYMI